MSWQNNLREIRIILYRLKRNFGLPATLRHVTARHQDVKTGRITITYSDHAISRAILLPTQMQATFSYDLTYIAANKNFTYGGIFTTKEKAIIIEPKDLPVGFVINADVDHLVIEHRRYDLKLVELAEHNEAWLIKATQLDSSTAE